MNALSLFTGIMGIDIACEWAGITTVAMCEKDPFCQKVIRKHKPDIPLYDDVCTLTKERLEADEIECSSIGLISSGDPCQPSSQAGERKGSDDDRHLWPETNRILSAIRPRWVLRENVIGNVTLGLDEVLTNLDDRGYTTQSFTIPACAIGADHERDRVFVVGYANRLTKSQENTLSIAIRKEWNTWQGITRKFRRTISEFYRKENEPPVCRVDDGISAKFYNDRMKALGNAVNPHQIYPIVAAIKRIDDMLKESAANF